MTTPIKQSPDLNWNMTFEQFHQGTVSSKTVNDLITNQFNDLSSFDVRTVCNLSNSINKLLLNSKTHSDSHLKNSAIAVNALIHKELISRLDQMISDGTAITQKKEFKLASSTLRDIYNSNNHSLVKLDKSFINSIENYSNIRINQNSIILQMEKYLINSFQEDKIQELKNGLCHGLTLLYCYYQFINQENEFYRRIGQVITTKTEEKNHNKHYNELTVNEKEIETICNDIFFLQKQDCLKNSQNQTLSGIETLKSVSDKEEIRNLASQFSYASAFIFDNDSDENSDLEQLLSQILRKDKNLNKCLLITSELLNMGPHYRAIFCRKEECFLYDSIFEDYTKKFDLSESNFEESVSKLSLLLSFLSRPDSCSQKTSFSLGIEVCSNDYLAELNQEGWKQSLTWRTESDSKYSPLIFAVKMGSVSSVQSLIDKGADVNQANHQGSTPLCVASQYGHLNIVKILLDYGAQINQTDSYATTPLRMSAANGHSTTVQHLIENNASIDLADGYGATPLLAATCEGHAETVRILLDHHADIKLSNLKGRCPLYVAAQNNHQEIVRLLLVRNADVNQTAKDLRTPAWIAAFHGHHTILLSLLENHADINLADEEGITPLYAASQNGHLQCVQTLLEEEAQINTTHHKSGKSALHIAVQRGHLEVVQTLFMHDANVNQTSNELKTPAWIAAFYGHHNILLSLIEHHADINLADKSGATPIFAASHEGNLQCVKTLLTNGANVHEPHQSGITPLHIAALNGHLEIVELLLMHNANPNSTTNTGVTALDFAKEKNHQKIVAVLSNLT